MSVSAWQVWGGRRSAALCMPAASAWPAALLSSVPLTRPVAACVSAADGFPGRRSGYLQVWWLSQSFPPGNFCLSLEYIGLSPWSRLLAQKMSAMDNILNVSMSATFVTRWIRGGFWVACGPSVVGFLESLEGLALGWLLVSGTGLWCLCKGSSPLPVGCLDSQMLSAVLTMFWGCTLKNGPGLCAVSCRCPGTQVLQCYRDLGRKL